MLQDSVIQSGMASGPTTLDWIALANAFFAMVSALAAVIAVGLVVWLRRADRRQYGFRRVVLDIALEKVPEFSTAATELLEGGQKELLSADCSLLPHNAVIDKTRALTEGFNSLFYRLRQTLRNAAIAWGDPTLSAAVDESLQQLQDAVTPAIAALAADVSARPLFASLVGEESARVLNTIVSHDK